MGIGTAGGREPRGRGRQDRDLIAAARGVGRGRDGDPAQHHRRPRPRACSRSTRRPRSSRARPTQNSNIIFGAVIDDALGDEVRVTVIATGFDHGTSAPSTARETTRRERRDRDVTMDDVSARRSRSRDDEIDIPSFLKDQLTRLARGSRRWRLAERARVLACCSVSSAAETLRRSPLHERPSWPRAPSSSASRAGRCRCSTRASRPSTWRFGSTRACLTSRTWAQIEVRGPGRRGAPAARAVKRPPPGARGRRAVQRAAAARTAACSTTCSPTASPSATS